MSSKKNKDILRARCFFIVLYPDNEKHLKALEKIKKEKLYAYILHDKDKTDDDLPKKPHYHVVIKFVNAHYKNAFCTEYDIEPNLVDITISLKASLLYLLHWNNHDKAEYRIDEVKGPLASTLQKYITNETEAEDEVVIDIVNIINDYKCYLNYTTLLIDICNKGLYGYYRRGYSIIKEVLIEHNSKYIGSYGQEFIKN